MMILSPESQGRPEFHSNVHGQMADASRRRALTTRRARYAREHGFLREAHRRYHLTAADTKRIDQAASHLVELMKANKVTRPQVESEQQNDQNRLQGYLLAAPHDTERLEVIRYRMRVRDQALDQFAAYELALLDSSTGRNDREVSSPMPRRPWQATSMTPREANAASTHAYLTNRRR